MFVASKIHAALESQAHALRAGAARAEEAVDLYGDAFDQMRSISSADVSDRLGGLPWPGARPTAEMDERGVIVPFGGRWDSAEEARAWALRALRGVPTAAIDGSQIAPSREFGVPLGLVQVAWFTNYHDGARPYIKDLIDEIVTSESADGEDEFPYAESRVNGRRFGLEMDVAAEQVWALAREDAPVVLVDGTFVLSFAGRMQPDIRDGYLGPLFRLLDASREAQVSVAGYVDSSLAADLTTMLRGAFDLPPARVPDGEILAGRMESFDRTAALRCAREDILPFYDTPAHDWREDLYFVYLKPGRDRLPARIDFPGWVLRAGLLDRVIDVIRAEIVVGTGYPYALETADATAVLTLEDRLQFYRTFHAFAEGAGLTSSVPRKMVSKAHRR